MPTLIISELNVKPLPPTTQHEYWCEECSFGRRANTFLSGSTEDFNAELFARKQVIEHKAKNPAHSPHTRMDCRNIDTTPSELRSSE